MSVFGCGGCRFIFETENDLSVHHCNGPVRGSIITKTSQFEIVTDGFQLAMEHLFILRAHPKIGVKNGKIVISTDLAYSDDHITSPMEPEES